MLKERTSNSEVMFYTILLLFTACASNLSWQRAMPVNVGWFMGYFWKNDKWYI